jgi:hypothetical protein
MAAQQGSMSWFRFYAADLADRRLARIAAMTGSSLALVLGVWSAVLCLASDSPKRGTLYLSPGIAYSTAELGALLGVAAEVMERLLSTAAMLNLVSTDELGAWVIVDWDRRQYTSDTSTSRVAAYRQRHGNVTETPTAAPCNGDETPMKRYSNVFETLQGVGGVTDQSRSDTEQIRSDQIDAQNARAAGAAPPVKATAKRKASEASAQTRSPAILALKAITGRNPPRELYDRLAAALGEQPDEAKLRALYEEWSSRGYNRSAWTWALEWYATGIPAHGGKAAPAQRFTDPTAGLSAQQQEWNRVALEEVKP